MMQDYMLKIGDVFKVSSGGTPSRKKEQYFRNGTIKWVKTGDLKGRFVNEPKENITEEALKNSSATVFPKNTVLIAMYGATIGACSILPFEASTNQACAALLPNENSIPEYVYYYFLSIKDDLIRKGVGGAQPNISAGIIKALKIPLPPLPEQRKIAAILDEADKLRQLNKNLITKYDELTQSLFLDMFGDPVTNPMGWELKSFIEVAKNNNSKRVPIKQADRDKRDGEYPYYGATGIIDYFDDYKFDGTYLLIAEDGKNLLFRKKNNAFMASGKFWVNNHAHILSFNGICVLKYLEFFLNRIDFGPFISGIDQIKLNKTSLNRIPVPVPPITLQNQFAERVEKIESQKAQAQESLVKAEALFGALLQESFGRFDSAQRP